MILADYSCPASPHQGPHRWAQRERLWYDAATTGATHREVVYRCTECGAEKSLDPPPWVVAR